jgi:hypothetical protein
MSMGPASLTFKSHMNDPALDSFAMLASLVRDAR